MIACLKSIPINQNLEITLQMFPETDLPKTNTLLDAAKLFTQLNPLSKNRANIITDELVENAVLRFNPEVDAELHSIIFYKPLGFKNLFEMISVELKGTEHEECKRNIEDFIGGSLTDKKLIKAAVAENLTMPTLFQVPIYGQPCVNASLRIIYAKKIGLL